ncbi:MAG: tRNA 2-thiouridine(34) synthase MnmA [Verrucomicrobiota bacterium]|nr:tRNA 2-thiouridine(34) synthase MnmA [Verrucomicrobiota bacterium]
MKRILIALSGGVDSAVAALLMKEQGYAVSAAYMKNWINEENVIGNCPWQQDIEDARAVADTLGIEFQVLNFIRDYRERIVNYLIDGYQRGITPNPDVMCNREMKFGVLLDWALARGYDAVATGHYCIRRDDPQSGQPQLYEGMDKNKDQSYFLSMITPQQLRHALFPVGHLRKPELRALAAAAGLPNAAKKDSQGICFIGEVRINDFLEKFIPDSPGPIQNTAGKVLGEHRGLHRYTLGQRKGIGIPSNSDFNHYVVVRKDYTTNTLVVAFDSKEVADLWQSTMRLHSLSWISEPVQSLFPADHSTTTGIRLLAKPRYRDASTPITYQHQNDGSAIIHFDEPQRALASGQVCALYLGERCLGGGIYH